MVKMLDVYDESMSLIGQSARAEVHRIGLWHKAFHCWVIFRDARGEEYVLLQKRSASKDTVPNSLDITAAGHLEAGETPEDGLRELKEELGIDIAANELHFLGVHVEVYKDEKIINREFDHVYLLELEKDLSDFRVQPEEVVALTRIRIIDGIDLFSGAADLIPACSVNFDDKGMPGEEVCHNIGIAEFAGGKRNNYFIKVFLLAQKYFAGERLLYI